MVVGVEVCWNGERREAWTVLGVRKRGKSWSVGVLFLDGTLDLSLVRAETRRLLY